MHFTRLFRTPAALLWRLWPLLTQKTETYNNSAVEQVSIYLPHLYIYLLCFQTPKIGRFYTKVVANKWPIYYGTKKVSMLTCLTDTSLKMWHLTHQNTCLRNLHQLWEAKFVMCRKSHFRPDYTTFPSTGMKTAWAKQFFPKFPKLMNKCLKIARKSRRKRRRKSKIRGP